MAIPFDIPASPFDIQPRDNFVCDSDCRSLSSPTISSSPISTYNLLSSSYYNLSVIKGCFRNDGTLFVSYYPSGWNSTNSRFYFTFVFEGRLQVSRFIPERLAFANNYYYDVSNSQKSYMSCDLVPIDELVYVPPDIDQPDFPASVYILPATILASLFFIFVYKMFKRVLF